MGWTLFIDRPPELRDIVPSDAATEQQTDFFVPFEPLDSQHLNTPTVGARGAQSDFQVIKSIDSVVVAYWSNRSAIDGWRQTNVGDESARDPSPITSREWNFSTVCV
jgi:hypothetical protein